MSLGGVVKNDRLGILKRTAVAMAQDISAADESERTNRLGGESSPYLLQHAHNPVDWYPWGREALDRARRENRPIFLSIGYAACHWCHVMERESFEDADIAGILNRHFVSIKVDREERPDLDQIYMTAVQLLTGSGGWPMSVFLTPDLKPFFAGTYFPPTDRYNRLGFRNLLLKLVDIWNTRNPDVVDSAGEIAHAVRDYVVGRRGPRGAPGPDMILRAIKQIEVSFDSRWGGFGGAPKFPSSGTLSLVLREYARTSDEGLLDMALLTLEKMAYGGIYDQLGGGFHRYSVDERWLVPHFEKMLYDNALLAKVYFDAHAATGRTLHKRIGIEILEYVLRDMTHPEGGFFSTEDADSEGGEGRYYLWTREEIEEKLGAADGRLLAGFYGVTEEGNFEGFNILHVPRSPEFVAHMESMKIGELQSRIKTLRAKLFAVRSKRLRPARDDKILAAWNALMISAFARGSQVTGQRKYGDAAVKAMKFLLDRMREDGHLHRTWRSGKLGVAGYLDDYAFTVNALVDLYETVFDPGWLQVAEELVGRMVDLFWDESEGAFFLTSERHGELLVRPRPSFDGAEPSGNSIAALALLRLGRLLDKSDYGRRAESILSAFSSAMSESPRGYLDMLSALDFYLYPGKEVVIAGEPDSPDTKALWEVVRKNYLPNSVFAAVYPQEGPASPIIPLLEGKTPERGRATAYVCENMTCARPVTTLAELAQLLE